MLEIKDADLLYMDGGLSISGTLINAFTGSIKIVLELGRSVGSAVRRGVTGSFCHV